MRTLRVLLIVCSSILFVAASAAADVLPPDAATETDAGLPRTDEGGCAVRAGSADVASIVVAIAALSLFVVRRRRRA